MAIKVLLLGRPGSGKTTAARHLAKLAADKGLVATHIDDYEILQENFRADTLHQRFRPVSCNGEYSGFDVVDFGVMDEALEETEVRARKRIAAVPSRGLVTIEFARDDYLQALKRFSADFLQDAHIIFFMVDTETSVQRVHQRYLKTGHHFVSEHILRSYYKESRPHSILEALKGICGPQKKIQVCDNTGSWGDFFRQINQFFSLLDEQEVHVL